MLGFFYYVDNSFSKAAATLETASRLNPNDPRALLYLALSEDGLGRPEVAPSLYRRISSWKPKSVGRIRKLTRPMVGFYSH